MDASDIAASAALTNLWDSLVRHVVGEDVIPVLLVMNWDRLHSVISKSLSSTAYLILLANGNINSSLVNKLVKCIYGSGAKKIPTVDYLGAEPGA